MVPSLILPGVANASELARQVELVAEGANWSVASHAPVEACDGQMVIQVVHISALVDMRGGDNLVVVIHELKELLREILGRSIMIVNRDTIFGDQVMNLFMYAPLSLRGGVMQDESTIVGVIR